MISISFIVDLRDTFLICPIWLWHINILEAIVGVVATLVYLFGYTSECPPTVWNEFVIKKSFRHLIVALFYFSLPT